MTSGRDDFAPTACWDVLRLRATLRDRLRAFFLKKGFLEVETPLLSADVVVDRNLDPFAVRGDTDELLYLQTSPEAAMKRLLAAGGEAIYQITHSFRQGERGRQHNCEFTMVEWYRTTDSYASGMEFLAELICELLPCERVKKSSYQDLFRGYVGINPHTASAGELRQAAQSRGIDIPTAVAGEDRDTLLEILFSECVEPNFDVTAGERGKRATESEDNAACETTGRMDRCFQPIIVYDFPASQAALAKVEPNQQGIDVARRFELYAGGLELANGYDELTDVAELERRTEMENAHRVQSGKQRLPGPRRLQAAMLAGLPACCGVALGFDRMVMLAAGATRIDEVIPFAQERA